ncbi:cytochrome P450 [Heliocybe sulcata]|uniref:Cytochrome P450 n=1 Tax=Heliocybe sulcata TaxID=5364 RepID=A0A5C3NKD4_9AGAM|nr:cytochrome P450 [Heliocybe sulcata]
MAETLVYGVAAVFVAYVLYAAYFSPTQRLLARIPTVGGPSGPMTSYIGAMRLLKNSPQVVREGYEKFNLKGSPFKVADLNRWIIVVSPRLIDEVKNAPEDVLSFSGATNDLISVDYTLRLNKAAARRNDYHLGIIRSRLTRNLNTLFPNVHEEIVAAFADLVAPNGDEWVKLPALSTNMQIVCRVSNRALTGASLCRNTDYGRIAVNFTLDVMKSALLLRFFPRFIKPAVGSRLPLVPRTVAAAASHLRPLIEERLRKMEEHGNDWTDKPNDMLQWFLEDAEGEERDLEHWTMRILLVNFASIHTTSMAFTQALYFLAANPEYIQPLLEEAEAVIKEEGWSRAALQKMWRIDSFLKESQRFTGIGSISLQRKVLKPYTFSDGTSVPVGAHVAVASQCIHSDEEHYADANIFNGWRFAEMREAEGEGTKHQLVSTGNDYLSFGHGRHACPGRFFAAAELKAMLAHLVLNYDVKLENEGVRPPDEWVGVSRVPNRTAEVMFRKRQI